VNGRSQLLPTIMKDAGAEGDAAEPRALLDTLASFESPLRALADHDQANALFEAFYREYPFLRGPEQLNPLQPEQRSRWVSLLRWLVRELRAWRAAADPSDSRLAAMLIVAQANDAGDNLWEQVREDIGSNAELVERLKALLRLFSIGIASRGGMPASIWEQEAIDAFQRADRAGDWVGIGSGLRLFEHQLIPSAILVQTVRCLYRCGILHLVDALANLHQTVMALQVTSALHLDQRVIFAVNSSNPYIEFAGVYTAISSRHATEQLSPAAEQMLSQVLLKVALDEPRWRAWMQLFNAYPVRYPALQEPLGAALAAVQEAAIDAYVDSIVLSVKPIKPVMPNPNRQCIASCLRRFRTSAARNKRAKLWSKAHERWSTWDFDRASPQTYLSNVSRSDLDYALVGFAVECMNDTDIEEVKKTIIAEMNTLENDWYGTSLDIISRFRRLLSRFQAYGHAPVAITSDEDWLTDTKVYFPFDPNDHQYFVMKYRLDVAS
jgi:hypothetical protein